MATATTSPAKAPKAQAAGPDLYKALLGKVKQARIGEVVEHPKGIYSRLMEGKRTLAYVVRGKKQATVFPNTLAASMPKEVKFDKVELGSHHYGRGEVVVPVGSEADFGNAMAALKASAKAPALPKKTPVAA